MLNELLPRSLHNNFRGYRIALWILGLLTAVRALQSVMIIFNGHDTVTNADGIPIDSYSADAAQTVLALFALVSVWRLIVCAMSVVALVRYRNAVPIIFVVHIASYLGALLLSAFVPLVRTGNPPGPWVNFALFALMVIGLGLSLVSRRSKLE